MGLFLAIVSFEAVSRSGTDSSTCCASDIFWFLEFDGVLFLDMAIIEYSQHKRGCIMGIQTCFCSLKCFVEMTTVLFLDV